MYASKKVKRGGGVYAAIPPSIPVCTPLEQYVFLEVTDELVRENRKRLEETSKQQHSPRRAVRHA